MKELVVIKDCYFGRVGQHCRLADEPAMEAIQDGLCQLFQPHKTQKLRLLKDIDGLGRVSQVVEVDSQLANELILSKQAIPPRYSPPSDPANRIVYIELSDDHPIFGPRGHRVQVAQARADQLVDAGKAKLAPMPPRLANGQTCTVTTPMTVRLTRDVVGIGKENQIVKVQSDVADTLVRTNSATARLQPPDNSPVRTVAIQLPDFSKNIQRAKEAAIIRQAELNHAMELVLEGDQP